MPTARYKTRNDSKINVCYILNTKLNKIIDYNDELLDYFNKNQILLNKIQKIYIKYNSFKYKFKTVFNYYYFLFRYDIEITFLMLINPKIFDIDYIKESYIFKTKDYIIYDDLYDYYIYDLNQHLLYCITHNLYNLNEKKKLVKMKLHINRFVELNYEKNYKITITDNDLITDYYNSKHIYIYNQNGKYNEIIYYYNFINYKKYLIRSKFISKNTLKMIINYKLVN